MTTSPTIMITGAGSGIGRELARHAAHQGWTLRLVSRGAQPLTDLVQELTHHYPALPLASLNLDLSNLGAAASLVSWLEHHPPLPSHIVLNAGMAFFGPFTTINLSQQLQTLHLGTTFTIDFLHRFLTISPNTPCHITIVGSTAGRKPVPYMAVYSSTKAFLHSLCLALEAEYHTSDVRFLLAIIGGVQTNFHRKAGFPVRPGTFKQSPATVAARLFEAIAANRSGRITIGSLAERLAGFIQPLFPRLWARIMAARYHRLFAEK